MIIPTLIMGVLAFVLLWIGYQRDGREHIEGLKSAWSMTAQALPMLCFAFIVAGMIQVLLPQDIVARWIGRESGMRGILIGSIAGGLTPGGPYTSFPIVAGLAKSGASVGTLVAFLTGWSLIAVGRLPFEVGIMGWKLTLIRFASSFFLPPIIGWLAQTIFGSVKV